MTYIPRRDAIVSTANSTATNLTASGVFTGIGEDVSQYASITLSVFANQPSAINGATIQFSTNNTQWDRVISRSINANQGESFVYPVEAQYYRVVYTNGGASQSQFRLQSIFHASKNLDAPITLDSAIQKNQSAHMARSVLAGQFGSDAYKNVPVNELGALSVALDEPVTSFDELVVANRTPTVQLSFEYNINSRLTQTTIVGTGYVTQANAMAVVATGVSTGASASGLLESRAAVRLRASQEAEIHSSGLFTLGVTGSEQLMGGGADSDGYFFGYNGAAFGVMRRNGGVDNWTAQSAWNIDPLDGTGPSGMVLDPTKGNLYGIDAKNGFYGPSYKIFNPATNNFVLVHVEPYANINTLPVVQFSVFRLIVSAANISNTTDMVVRVSNTALFLNGELLLAGIRGAVSNSKTAVGTALTNIFTLRNKALFAGKTNYIRILLLLYSAAVDGTKPSLIQLVFNAALGGTPVWNDYDVNDSVIEFDTAGTTVTGGLAGGIIALDNIGRFDQNLVPLRLVLSPGDTLTLAGQATQNNTDITASIIWQEDS